MNPSKGTHLSPIQHKNVTRTFCQTPNMQQNTTPWKMHEHDEICLNTCLICHMGPTQIQTHQMGLSPIKILKKFAQN